MKTLEIPIDSLLEAFEDVPDPRGTRGRRHPLPAILGLCTVAMLCGCTTMKAIARFGKDHPKLRAKLGFRHAISPAPSTFCKLFKKLDPGWVEPALAQFLALNFTAEALALDGKVLRGSRYHKGGKEVLGRKIVSAFLPEADMVLALQEADNGNELGAGRLLLRRLDLDGKIVTGDAGFVELDICMEIWNQGGDYVFTVKRDQPTLHDDIAATFAAFPPSESRFMVHDQRTWKN